jgi:hypothetical protein
MAFEHTRSTKFQGADCDADSCLVVSEVRGRWAVNKQAAQKFDVVIFNLRKVNGLVVRKQCQTEITSRFAALEN